MLQSTKNKQTIEILKRLRQQGAPAPTSVPLDMVAPEEGAPDLDEETPDAEIEGLSAVLTDTSIPGVGLRAKKKRKPEEAY